MTMLPIFSQHLTFFAADQCAPKTFFLIPSWYEYLYKAGRLGLDSQSNTCSLLGQFNYSDLSLIGLAIFDILLRIGAMVTIGFIIYGGIQYVTSQGEPDKTSQAQTTIVNALIGLVITTIAATVVSFIGSNLG